MCTRHKRTKIHISCITTAHTLILKCTKRILYVDSIIYAHSGYLTVCKVSYYTVQHPCKLGNVKWHSKEAHMSTMLYKDITVWKCENEQNGTTYSVSTENWWTGAVHLIHIESASPKCKLCPNKNRVNKFWRQVSETISWSGKTKIFFFSPNLPLPVKFRKNIHLIKI